MLHKTWALCISVSTTKKSIYILLQCCSLGSPQLPRKKSGSVTVKLSAVLPRHLYTMFVVPVFPCVSTEQAVQAALQGVFNGICCQKKCRHKRLLMAKPRLQVEVEVASRGFQDCCCCCCEVWKLAEEFSLSQQPGKWSLIPTSPYRWRFCKRTERIKIFFLDLLVLLPQWKYIERKKKNTHTQMHPCWLGFLLHISFPHTLSETDGMF